MKLFDLCIKRPVLATVLSLIVVLLGLISYQRLSVREYPKIDEPIVSVSTGYKGASPEVIESQITKTLEDSLSGIEGVSLITSNSRSERSDITVSFNISKDPDVAAAEVRDKVARVRARLPDAADEPVIAKQEADSFPVMWFALTSDKHSQLELSDTVNRVIKPRLLVLPGAADLRLFGERRISMRIFLDPQKLAAYRLTPADVEAALRSQNVEIPSGRIESRLREFNVLTQTDLQTPEQFGNVVIAQSSGYSVRIRDVAKVEIAAAEERGFQRFMGKTAIGFGIIRQSTGNPLDLSNAVKREIPIIQENLPQGMKIELNFDSSVFIAQSIKAVFTTIGEAVLLVALVIFFFLRSFRATIIPLITIPVSLIGAFFVMYAFGFTINTLTLLAMVLAVGLVVDDAIVVLENIYRNIENGMDRIQAALVGTREIGFAVIAMTLTLAAVFAPLAFATGRTGRLFIEFALALAGAVLVSGFVALTLSPMMCSVLLKHQPTHSKLYNAIERLFEAMNRGYRRSLGLALDNRIVIILIAVIVAGVAAVQFKLIKTELSPLEDRGVIFGFVSAPEGSTSDYLVKYVQQVEGIYQQLPEMQAYGGNGGFPNVADGTAILRLKDWSARERSQAEVAKELFPKFQSLAGVSAFPSQPGSLGQSPRAKPIEFVIMAPVPYDQMQGFVQRMQEEMRKNPGFTNIDTDLRMNTPELRVRVDRDRVLDVGASVDTVGRTLETMLGGRLVTRFKQDGEQYDVIVQVARDGRDTPDRIKEINVRNRAGEMVPLSNLLTLREGVSPRSIAHFQRVRSATVNANLQPGYTQGEAIKYMQDAAKRVLPATAQTDLAGQSREFRDSSSDIYFVFLLALGFIYLVLAAQFESFIDPLIIMLTVPLSITGALLALQWTGSTLNIYSQIGLITLVGLITKHGILIVEFANQLRDRGHNVRDAVVEAAELRLRPILMTTGAMVLGAIPLALAKGAGAESRSVIGWVIVGGMTLGTLLTLYVVPTAYTLLARRNRGERDRAFDRAENATHQGAPIAAE
ncbi:MAG: efflux RND transporter permease subunit [Burkholderiales bacterium]|nr:MAG: efflux RND transporter permease subunit [Burkholderiales bacterium]TAG82614.1 MAG: efflux RND transporter permease subunit [Betaproteobacteria bacterium]